MSMSIDPRLLTTPIGAVIGLVIAKKALKPEDQTAGNLTIGAGIGAVTGALAGQFIKGERLSMGEVTADRLRQNIRRNALENPRPGNPTEIAAVDANTPGGLFPGVPEGEGEGTMWERTRYNHLSQPGVAGAVQQGAYHRANVQELTRTLKYNSNLSPEQQKKIRSNISEHQRMADANRADVRNSLIPGYRAAWGTLWNYIREQIP